jgi:hypothetical protein
MQIADEMQTVLVHPAFPAIDCSEQTDWKPFFPKRQRAIEKRAGAIENLLFLWR